MKGQYDVGARVEHPAFGAGTVSAQHDNDVTVHFDAGFEQRCPKNRLSPERTQEHPLNVGDKVMAESGAMGDIVAIEDGYCYVHFDGTDISVPVLPKSLARMARVGSWLKLSKSRKQKAKEYIERVKARHDAETESILDDPSADIESANDKMQLENQVISMPDDTVGMWDWMMKRIRKGELTDANMPLAKEVVRRFVKLHDHFLHHGQKDLIPAFNSMNLPELEQWVQNTEESPDLTGDWEDSQTVYRFDDGWRVDMVGAKDMPKDGKIMNNCMGYPFHKDQVANGQSVFYSVRNPNGHPYATIKLMNDPKSTVGGDVDRGPWTGSDYNAGRWQVAEVEGRGQSMDEKKNLKPEYLRRVEEFLKSGAGANGVFDGRIELPNGSYEIMRNGQMVEGVYNDEEGRSIQKRTEETPDGSREIVVDRQGKETVLKEITNLPNGMTLVQDHVKSYRSETTIRNEYGGVYATIGGTGGMSFPMLQLSEYHGDPEYEAEKLKPAMGTILRAIGSSGIDLKPSDKAAKAGREMEDDILSWYRFSLPFAKALGIDCLKPYGDVRSAIASFQARHDLSHIDQTSMEALQAFLQPDYRLENRDGTWMLVDAFFDDEAIPVESEKQLDGGYSVKGKLGRYGNMELTLRDADGDAIETLSIDYDESEGGGVVTIPFDYSNGRSKMPQATDQWREYFKSLGNAEIYLDEREESIGNLRDLESWWNGRETAESLGLRHPQPYVSDPEELVKEAHQSQLADYDRSLYWGGSTNELAEALHAALGEDSAHAPEWGESLLDDIRYDFDTPYGLSDSDVQNHMDDNYPAPEGHYWDHDLGSAASDESTYHPEGEHLYGDAYETASDELRDKEQQEYEQYYMGDAFRLNQLLYERAEKARQEAEAQQPKLAWVRAADYQGWTNWDTWNTDLMMDEEQKSYKKVREIVKNGGGPEDLAKWVIPNVIGPVNKQAIKDAQEWNGIPEEERIDHHFEDFKEKVGPELAEQWGSPDVADYSPDLIDPEMVNWHEIYEGLRDELDGNDEYAREDERLRNDGLTFHMPGHSDETNQMLDAWLKHHGVHSKDQKVRLPGSDFDSSAEHWTYMDVPAESYKHNPGNESPEQHAEWLQNGTARPRVREYGWDTIHDIKNGRANEWQIQRMKEALTAQGYTPEQIEQIMRQTHYFDEYANKLMPLEQLAPKKPDPSLDKPGDLTLPEGWTR